MKDKLEMGARIVLGLLLLVFGLNGFLQFMPMPQPPEAAAAFFGAMAATGYLIPLIKVMEIVIGLLLLAKKFVPAALIFLAPLTVNFVAFHLFLDLAGIGVAAVTAVLHGYLIYANWDVYKPLCEA